MEREEERRRLLALYGRWAAAPSDGSDIDEVMSYWTDDAVVLAPGLPLVTGRSAIRDYVTRSLHAPGFRTNWASSEVTLSADGTLAYVIGSNRVTIQAEDGTSVLNGRVVTIWRRNETDGQWRCAVDVWNVANQNDR